ncbi:MAG: 1-acyl-sn-glycerol-3-phosphate acyltransferase [Nocardioidaceae bacterium]
MGDAEIIPIGTRGRPGRGSGRQRPSAATRRLAAETTPAEPKQAAAPRRRTAKPAAATADTAEIPTSEAAAPDAGSAASAPPGAEAPTADGAAATTEERSPLAGIPAAEWAAAFQAAVVDVLGQDWQNRLAHLMAYWRRRLEGDYTVDDYGFDAELTQLLVLSVLRPVAEKWFRIEVRGIDDIPADGGALVVSNHSGTLPVDALMTMSTIHERTGRFIRPLGADLVFRLPVVSSLARKTGATLACNEDAERMLRGGELVGVWPEGFKGIGKPFSERYRLQRFGRGGFVSAALNTGVPIVPLSVVGAEEIYPMIGNLPSLARLLGVPYLPITPTFPWLGPLGMIPLPSKWLMEFGEPIRTDAIPAGAAEDPMFVFNVTDQVRETIQQTLYALLRDRESVFGANLPDWLG